MSQSERILPLFPLEQVVLFPGMPLPLRIFEERYKVMIGMCHVTDQLFGVVLIKEGREVGAPAQPERVGCTARIVQVERLPEGRMSILAVGEQRFRMSAPARVMPEGYLVGDVQLLPDAPASVAGDLLDHVASELLKYERSQPSDVPTDPVALSYRVAASLRVHPKESQQLLEIDEIGSRLRHELALLRRENQPRLKTVGPFSLN
jgi:Lon protease-like protein